jgi:curved DNA-binding protein CbpA
MIPNYYKILGLKHDAKKEDIKKAYRVLALKFHPDRNTSVDAHEKFITINEAYLILYDDEARQKYDKEYFSIFGYQNDLTNISYVEDTTNIFNDEELNNWVRNAREQGERYAKMAFNEFYRLIKSFVKELIFQISNALLIIIGALMFVYGTTVFYEDISNPVVILSLIIGLGVLLIGVLREKNHNS